MIISIVAIVIYFLMSWLVPWPSLGPNTSISFSYLFDLIYVFVIHLVFKRKLSFSFDGDNKKYISIISSFIFSVLCIVIIKQLNLMAPFKYVDDIGLQLLVFAPLVEELVFRGAFYALLSKLRISLKLQAIINSALFSFSHIIGLKYLPEVFSTFIYFQILYTFVLGWMCFKARLKSKGIWLPILVHFAFNLVFYISVKYFEL